MTGPPETTIDHQQTDLPGCWWHPDRPTGLSCTRCERPACPDCLREASVGYHCIDCAELGRQQARRSRPGRPVREGDRTIAGAVIRDRIAVTPILIAINVVIYALTAAQANNLVDNRGSALLDAGMLFPPEVALSGEWWRLVTSGFLHFGIIHLAVNMISLWILGRDLELLLGRVRFLAIYLASLLGGAASVYVFDEVNRATVGASGAIYGLLGGVLIAVLRLRLNPVPALAIIALNIFISIRLPGISLLGHLGGLVIGVVAVAAMLYAPRNGRAGWQAGAIVALLAVLVGAVIFRDGQILDQLCTLTNQCV